MPMLDNLTIVLVTPKFSENVGAAARACANMGGARLCVVNPQRWEPKKAAALATPKGMEILDAMRVETSLVAALAPHTAVWATTARHGGWRKAILTPAQAAPDIIQAMRTASAEGAGGPAVVFGAEDRGLTNEEIEICGQLLTIPTAEDAWSLNLAQAVLIVLYECFNALPKRPFRPGAPFKSRLINLQEREILYQALQEALLAIDFLKDDNLDYWMLPVRRLLQRQQLRRNEFNLVMGVCRQILWAMGKVRAKRPQELPPRLRPSADEPENSPENPEK